MRLIVSRAAAQEVAIELGDRVLHAELADSPSDELVEVPCEQRIV